jgi:hypothetical protein
VIGQFIFHYRAIEKLGEGGIDEVYLAKDTVPESIGMVMIGKKK